MKRLSAIIYTLLVIVLCFSLYTNYEQSERLSGVQIAIEHYEQATLSYEESIIGYQTYIDTIQPTLDYIDEVGTSCQYINNNIVAQQATVWLCNNYETKI